MGTLKNNHLFPGAYALLSQYFRMLSNITFFSFLFFLPLLVCVFQLYSAKIVRTGLSGWALVNEGNLEISLVNICHVCFSKIDVISKHERSKHWKITAKKYRALHMLFCLLPKTSVSCLTILLWQA